MISSSSCFTFGCLPLGDSSLTFPERGKGCLAGAWGAHGRVRGTPTGTRLRALSLGSHESGTELGSAAGLVAGAEMWTLSTGQRPRRAEARAATWTCRPRS